MGKTMWCAACNACLDVSANAPGSRIRCGDCQTVLVVPEDLPVAAPIARAPTRPGPAAGPAPAARSVRPPLRSVRGRALTGVPNLLPWAIAAAILCCQVGGVIAIVYAVQANSAAERGQIPAARRAANTARTWLWISAFTPFALLGLALATGFWSIR